MNLNCKSQNEIKSNGKEQSKAIIIYPLWNHFNTVIEFQGFEINNCWNLKWIKKKKE